MLRFSGCEQAIGWNCDLLDDATLPPGGQAKCTGHYVVTQDDLDNGQV